jgi:hypothetical protein
MQGCTPVQGMWLGTSRARGLLSVVQCAPDSAVEGIPSTGSALCLSRVSVSHRLMFTVSLDFT